MKTLIGSGAHTNVYSDQDSEYGEIVIKEPKGNPTSGDVLFYVKKQMHGHNIVKRLRDSAPDIGVDLPRVIRAIDTPEHHAIYEKKLPGTPLTPEIYKGLNAQQRDAIANKLARFLNAMHQMQAPQPATESIKHRFTQTGTNPTTLAEFNDALDNQIPEKYQKLIASAAALLDSGDISDEIRVMTHKDVRGQNLMYDVSTGNLAVIDFEMASVDNIYSDLISYVPCNGLPWDLTKRIVTHYNAIQDKKYPITLDINKVRAAMIYGRAHEIARNINRQRQRDPNFHLPDDVIPELTSLLDELSAAPSAYARAAAKIKEKSDAAMAASAIKNIQSKNAEHD